MRNQSLRRQTSTGKYREKKIDELSRFRLRREEKIQTVVNFLDSKCGRVNAMLQNELFEIEERLLVIDFLTNLHDRLPIVGRLATLTFRAHLIVNEKFDDENLLENRRAKYLR